MIAVAVGVVLLAGAIVGWQWRQIHVFVDGGGWAFGGHAVVGGGLYAGDMAIPRKHQTGTVTLDHLSPDVVENTANATVRFYVCRRDPDSRVGGVGIVEASEVHRYCASLDPAEGATFTLDDASTDQLVMGVFPTRPGIVRVRGVHLDYSSGWQGGSQWTGGTVVVRVAAP